MASVTVLRLTFAVSNGIVRLADKRRTEMTLPPSDPVAEYHGRAGNWFEVDNADGIPLYGRRITDPMPAHHEVFGTDGKARWLPRSTAATEFEILAPLLPGAATVVVFSSSVGGDRTTAAQEITRINLRDIAP